MNKNLLLLAAAGGLFLYLRNKSSQAPQYTAPVNAGATSYVPATVPATVPTTGNWLTNLASGVATGATIVHTGLDLYHQVVGSPKAGASPLPPVAAAGFAPEWPEGSNPAYDGGASNVELSR